MMKIEPTERDDAHFVAIVNQLLNSLVSLQSPKEVYAVQIDHWFDHKWQYFSGKAMGALGIWKPKVTIPPFDPGRVVSQRYFRSRAGLEPSYEIEDAKPLHLDQWPGNNMHRFITGVSSSGLFLWYSGETNKTDRASVMVYLTDGSQTITWSASFVKSNQWRLNKVRGISRNQFDQMVA